MVDDHRRSILGQFPRDLVVFFGLTTSITSGGDFAALRLRMRPSQSRAASKADISKLPFLGNCDEIRAVVRKKTGMGSFHRRG
jgi:hypothetical protein